MSEEKFRQIEKLLGRELSDADKERLRRIKDVLQISAHDAVWDLLAAMEYQRVYYEELPAKIATASAEILRGLSAAADKEVAAAQDRLAESVAEQAKNLSVRVNLVSLLPMGLTALVCLLLYGSLLLWAGFRIGSGQAHPPDFLLRMPSGILMGGLCIAGGGFLGIHAAKAFAEGKKGGRKPALTALVMLLAGGVVFGLAL
jgi:hypothetical protein